MKRGFPIRYFAVTFIWTWLFEIPLMLAGLGVIPVREGLLDTLLIPVMVVAALGPAMGAFYSLRTLKGPGSIKAYLKGFFDLCFGWRAWIIPFIILGGTTCIAWFLPELWGMPRLAMQMPVWTFPAYLLIMIFFGGGQEELGWRGYILDPLEEHLGPWLGNLVLGVVWAVWHLPLFFIPGSTQAAMNFGGFTLLAVGYCFLFSWVRQASGKRPLSGLVVHGTANTFIPYFLTVDATAGAAQPRFWIWVCLTFLAGLAVKLGQTRREKLSASSGKISVGG